MKRLAMVMVILVLASLAASPGWAAPARGSGPAESVFGWLGAIWKAIWEGGGVDIDPNGDPAASVWANTEPQPQGGCGIDPDGRPLCQQ